VTGNLENFCELNKASGSVCLSCNKCFFHTINQRIIFLVTLVFFIYNKLMNSTFTYDFLDQKIG
jgi:hypothetical protein